MPVRARRSHVHILLAIQGEAVARDNLPTGPFQVRDRYIYIPETSACAVDNNLKGFVLAPRSEKTGLFVSAGRIGHANAVQAGCDPDLRTAIRESVRGERSGKN